jgi:hypothetical protein
MRNTIIRLLWLVLLAAPTLFAIDNLKLNPHLDYGSDSLDGPLITGTNAQSGFVSGKTNYVIMYGEGCLNSKRQARRTVELYDKYAPRCILWSSILMLALARTAGAGQEVLHGIHPSCPRTGCAWRSPLQPSHRSGLQNYPEL